MVERSAAESKPLRHFDIVLNTRLSPAMAWARVLDLRAHDRLIPFTHITEGLCSADELHPGHRFVACTMLGRVGFNDVMTIESVAPPAGAVPGHARIVKSGRLVLGSIDLTVSAHDGGASVRWSQDVGVGRFARPVRWAAERVAPLFYRATLRRLLRAG